MYLNNRASVDCQSLSAINSSRLQYRFILNYTKPPDLPFFGIKIFKVNLGFLYSETYKPCLFILNLLC